MARGVRLLSIGFGAALALLQAGCEAPATWPTPALDYVRVPYPMETDTRARRQALGAEGDPLYLFLNFCREDCTFRPGNDDARQRTSSIVRREVTLSESALAPEQYDELLRCLYQIFEPYDVLITDERPPRGRYVEAVVAGTPRELGLSPTIAGISPLACGLIEYGINFNFFGAISRSDGMGELCNVIAHETGHTIGLEHAYLCEDVMTYLPHCEQPAYFTRADTQCGGFFPESCTCGAEYQNSHLTVLAEVGPRRHPIVLPPELRILSPEPLVSVEQGFFVVAEVKSDRPLRAVQLFLDEEPVGVLTEPPFAFATPIDWPPGPISVRVNATSMEGLTSTATRELEVRPRPAEWDAGFLDAAGPRPDAGERWPALAADDAGDEGSPRPALDDEGCACVRLPSNLRPSATPALLVGAALLAGLTRRRRRALAGVLSLAAGMTLWGCDTDFVSSAQPALESDPQPGSPIDFGEIILGERQPRPRDVRLENRGQASLLLAETRVSETPSGAFTLIGPLRERVAPEASTELLLGFEALRPGPIDAELTLETNDPEHPEVSFPVRGLVRERCRLEPWPTALDFTLDAEREVVLLSASTQACRITGIGLDDRIFELVDPPSLPLTLNPAEELPLRIRHHSRTRDPHVPTRTLRVYEAETAGADVRLIGAYPIWNCLEVHPLEHEFPKTAAGVRSEALLTVTNRCLEPALIDSLAFPYGGEAFLPSGLDEPLVVQPRQSVGLELAFRPPDGLEYYGRVRLGTNDARRPALYAGLIGRGFGPVYASPAELDLGAVPFPSPSGTACAAPPRRLPISNLGEGGLRVHGLEFTGPDAERFSVEGVRVNGSPLPDWRDGFDVPGHGTAEVELRFEPGRALPSEHRATLAVRHTPEETVHSIELLGQARGAAESTEFFQVAPAEVDLLFVVDGSRSMIARHASLGAQIEAVMERLDLETASSQVSVVSARRERPEAGRLLGCRFRDPVISGGAASATERAQDFGCALALNTLDERPQAGLLSAALSLERAAFPSRWDPTSFDNRRFLRREAHLALVFLSDEDDLGAGPVELHHSLYRGAKGGRQDLLRAHALVVPPGQRCAGERYSVPGERYAQLAQLAQGTVEDICPPDLAPALERILDRALAPPRGFPLSHWAEPSSVAVYVNGVPALADRELGYELDRETNTIVFAPAAAPPLGATAEVRYRSVCAP